MNPIISFALELGGAAALLLWGVHMVQSGMQRAFGAQLRLFLGNALRGRLGAFAAGLAVTTALQSSTATGLMATGFMQAGLVSLVPALAVMLGANVGSALIVQALSLPVAAAAPLLIVVGVLMFRRLTGAGRDLGRVFIGLGLILLALRHLVGVVEPYEHAPAMLAVLEVLSDQWGLAIVLGVLLAWAAHSSVAVVLLVMSFAGEGLVTPLSAVALTLGANLGTTLNPVFEAPSHGDVRARRLPIGNLLMRVLGAAVAVALLPSAIRTLSIVWPDTARLVADTHVLFNIVLALIFLPLLGPMRWMLEKMMPERAGDADPHAPLYLEPSARGTPVIALGSAARETLRLADALERMLAELRQAFAAGQRQRIVEAHQLDDILDGLNAAIKSYITALDPDALNDDDHRRAAEILSFATHLEQAGDLVDKRLLSLASKRIRRGVAFSSEGAEELLQLVDRLIGNVRAAASLFVNRDTRAARLLAEEKVAFRDLVANAGANHFGRLRKGLLASAETSDLHLDILSVLKQVNSHLIEGAAYPLLESTGQLLPSRLRPLQDTAGAA